MDLAELKFVVDTKELELAATRVAELGTAVSKLNKPMQDLSKESAKSNKELSKAEEAAAKAALAQLKLQQAQEKTTESVGKSTSVLERQNLILEYMAQGNSKGQASILATAKAAGALDGDMLALNQTLKTQRTLIGGDPFDKSIGLMQKLQNEYKTTLEVTTLFNRNLGLTEKQMTDLAREKERLIALYGIEGRDIKELAGEYDQLIRKSVALNQANDSRTNSMRQQVKAQNDTAKANSYISSEMERVNRLTESNGVITSGVNNKLIKFEQALKQSGQTAAQQTVALEKYKASLMSIQKAGGDRQVDYLSRALGPQITDIAVGLATGQAPLTILLQQGGQLRDQFALAGVAGSEMGKMLVQASKAMASSIKDIGMAMGQLVTGAITGMGKAVTDFGMQITGTSALLGAMRSKIVDLQGANSLLVKSFDAAGKALTVFTGLGIVAVIASLAMLAKGLYDVIKQEDALTTQLVLTGASLGLNTASANQYAQSLNNVGVNTSTALQGIAAMAKEGGFLASEITTVVTAANNLKFAGVAIEDTVKQFAKLKEKPLEALIEIARATGLVKPEIVALVAELELQGKTSEAAAVAMKAYADVTVQQKDRLKEELSGFAIFMKALSTEIADFFDSAFRAIFRKSDPSVIIQEQIKAIDDILNNNAGVGGFIVSQTGIGAEGYRKQKDALVEQLMVMDQLKVAEISKNNDNIRTAKALGEWQKLSITNLDKQAKIEKDVENIRKVGLEAKKSEAEIEKLIADYREKNKPPKSDAEKEADRLRKAYISDLSKISNLTNASIKEQEDYTKAQKLALDIFASPEFQKYPEKQRIEIAQALERAHAEELIANELERQKKISEEVVKTRNQLVEAGAKQVDSAKVATQAIVDEAAMYDYKLTLIGKEEKEVEKLLALKKIQIEYEKEIARIKALNLMSGAREDLEAEAYKQLTLKRENIDKDANLKAAQDFQKQFDNIQTGISDSLVTALFEGGKAGSKKLRDVIIAELKKPITIMIKAIVDLASSGLNSMLGGAAGSTLGSTVTSMIGGIAVGGTTLAAGASAFGQGLISGFGTGAPVASLGSATSGAFNMGAAAAPVAGAVGGMAANRVISNGYSTGKNSQTIQDIATVAATMVFGPLGGLVAGAASGVFNRAFGMKAKQITGEGIIGTLTAQGADVKAFEDWFQKGGWFRKNKSGRSYSAVSASLQEYLDLSLQGLGATTKAYATALGLEADSIDTVQKAIELNLKGLSAEDRQKKIDEALGGFGDELAKKLGFESFDALQKLGEQVLQERYNLETQLLELQGNTVALKAREREQIYETNRALFDQIQATKDKQKADEEAAQAMEKLTAITTTIVDEINRLRGVNTSSTGLEAQFAILTAQARSGDLAALAQLPEVTKGLEQIAASSAVNATDIIVARARLAQSLQDTLGYVGSNTMLDSAAPISSVSSVSTGAATSVNASSSNQELLAALVTEVQGLRVEMRADVSHNAKTAKILERVNQDGESLTITTLV